MELAADALDMAAFTSDSRVAYRELLSKYLPEVQFRGKENQRIQYAVLVAFA